MDDEVPGHDLSGHQSSLVDVGGRGRLQQGSARNEASDERLCQETTSTNRRPRSTGD